MPDREASVTEAAPDETIPSCACDSETVLKRAVLETGSLCGSKLNELCIEKGTTSRIPTSAQMRQMTHLGDLLETRRRRRKKQ